MTREAAPNSEPWAPATLRWISELDDLESVMKVLSDPDLDEVQFCRAACRRILSLEGGVEALYLAAWTLPKLKAPTSILTSLWAARDQRHVEVMFDVSHLPGLNIPISQEVAIQASRRLTDLMAEATSDGVRFHAVLQFALQDLFTRNDSSVGDLAALIADSSISLTLPLIDELEGLVANDSLPEHEYQVFLATNPVFLDPLAAEAIDRHRLGGELVTDFVIRRHDSRYVAVEIEKPRDRIFTLQGDFTAEFTHAFGQVVDFIGWLDENVAYARTKLPELEAPDGLLVMGRRSELNAKNTAKLKRYCQNSRRVEVWTFDDLVIRARHLYESIRYHM